MSRYVTIKGTVRQIQEFESILPASIDTLVERIEIILDMYPVGLHVAILLMDKPEDVQAEYKIRYEKECDYLAFISLGRMEIVLALSEFSVKMLSHELGHAIVEQYFTERPPHRIHELLAQYVESKVAF